jgi:hypothetical protein
VLATALLMSPIYDFWKCLNSNTESCLSKGTHYIRTEPPIPLFSISEAIVAWVNLFIILSVGFFLQGVAMKLKCCATRILRDKADLSFFP